MKKNGVIDVCAAAWLHLRILVGVAAFVGVAACGGGGDGPPPSTASRVLGEALSDR